MNAPLPEKVRDYKLSSAINIVIGGVMLLCGIWNYFVSGLGEGVLGFLVSAIVCLSIGFAHCGKYLSLKK